MTQLKSRPDQDLEQTGPESGHAGSRHLERSEPATPLAGMMLSLQRQVGNAAVTALVQRAPAATAQPGTATKQDDAEALVDQYSHALGAYLDTDGLGADLLKRLPGEAALAKKVISSVNASRKADLADAIILKATDDEIKSIGADPGGKDVLLGLISAWQAGPGASGKKQEAMNRVIKLISPSHARLTDEAWAGDPAVTGALKSSGATAQSPKDWWASGPLIYDEYGVTMEAMPSTTTPEAFLAEMENDLNTAVSNYVFDMINEFQRASTATPPQVGEIIHIDIKGPDNGSVMLVEKTPSHFIFQTVTTKQDGTHPEYGSREFGFQRNPDGSIMFYTRGASRAGMMPGSYTVGRRLQTMGWEGLTKGIGNKLTSRGGKVRGFSEFSTHPDR